MSEDNVQPVHGDNITELPPVIKDTAQEVATEPQEPSSLDSATGELIAESKKYRARAQESEAKLADFERQAEVNRQKQLETKKEWEQLANERAAKIAELEPIVARAIQEEQNTREQILSEFSNEDRETFGDLPLDKLKALHSKLITNAKVPIANNAAVPSNEVPKDWTELSDKDRKNNWSKIVGRYSSMKR